MPKSSRPWASLLATTSSCTPPYTRTCTTNHMSTLPNRHLRLMRPVEGRWQACQCLRCTLFPALLKSVRLEGVEREPGRREWCCEERRITSIVAQIPHHRRSSCHRLWTLPCIPRSENYPTHSCRVCRAQLLQATGPGRWAQCMPPDPSLSSFRRLRPGGRLP